MIITVISETWEVVKVRPEWDYNGDFSAIGTVLF